jgi:heme exporter protein B
MIDEISAIIHKDFLLEWKTRFGINTVVAFVFSSLVLVVFSMKAQQLTPTSRSGLLWVIIVFAALSSLSRSFVSETERKTFDYLRLYARATPVYIGKLAVNISFTLLISLVSFVAFVILLNISVASWPVLLSSLVLGSVGLASVSTLLAGIIAQADRKGAVFSVISMPLMIPLLLLIVRLSKAGFTDGYSIAVWSDLIGIMAFCGVMITLSILLFDVIWDE